MRNVRSSTTGVSLTRRNMWWPAGSRAAHRRTAAAQSAAVTAAPSEDGGPARRSTVSVSLTRGPRGGGRLARGGVGLVHHAQKPAQGLRHALAGRSRDDEGRDLGGAFEAGGLGFEHLGRQLIGL